jgi:hypothetical protein
VSGQSWHSPPPCKPSTGHFLHICVRVLGLSLCAVVAVACSGSTTPTDGTSSGGAPTPVAPHACDPLAGVDTPLTVANILGAGRHPDGTLYVVDDGGKDHQRAFISNGSVVQRFIVSGSGSSGGDNLTVSIKNPDVTIRIDNPGPHPTKMGVVRGPLDDKTFDVGAQGDVLEIVGRDALAGFTVKNVPGNVDDKRIKLRNPSSSSIVIVSFMRNNLRHAPGRCGGTIGGY